MESRPSVLLFNAPLSENAVFTWGSYSNSENYFYSLKLTTLRVPHPSIGILNKAYSEVTLSGLQVELPEVKSIAGERGGSVREAGTEKTKCRSIVHAGG